MIYFDNAATTLQKPPQVAEAVANAINSYGNPSRGGYESALEADRMIYQTRVKLSALLGCSAPDRVIFTANATEALNIAISGLLSPGDHVITTDLEHNSVLRPLYRVAEHRQVELSFISADTEGCINLSGLQSLLKPNTKAIVCTHASNVTGNSLDLTAIGQFAQEHGLHFVVDGAQTAGILPIDMEQMGISVFCFTGHKGLYGPQGTGGMCVAPGVELRPWKVGGTGVQSYLREQPSEYPTRLEAGTLNGHGIAGLSAGLDFIHRIGIEHIHQHEIGLMRRFLAGVTGIPGINLYGNFKSDKRAAIVSLTLGEEDSGWVAWHLAQDYGIAVRSGAHCAPRIHQAMGTEKQGTVRFSFSWFNTEAEIDAAIQALWELSE